MALAATWERNILIHDTRVVGTAPQQLAHTIFSINENSGLDFIFKSISIKANEFPDKKIVNLYIIAHGIYAQSGVYEKYEDHGKTAYRILTGCGPFKAGQGLLLGKENLNTGNINILDPIIGKVGKIILYACGGAGGTTHVFNEKNILEKQTTCDDYMLNWNRIEGHPFYVVEVAAKPFEFVNKVCKKTLAVVFASNDVQSYHTQVYVLKREHIWQRRKWVLMDTDIDLGEWEGQVYKISPPNAVAEPVHLAENDYL